jgi:hypothetical protein
MKSFGLTEGDCMAEPDGINDPVRLSAVEKTGLLDSGRDQEFDQLTRLAAAVLAAPSAFVTVIGGDRQFVKSDVLNGEPGDLAGRSQPLSKSFCKHVVASREPLIVEDARDHELVKDNDAVDAGVIAYAGVPLQTPDGQAVGALCVVDSKPRKWSEEDLENLRALARSAMKLIDERQNAVKGNAAGFRHAPALDLLQDAARHLRAVDRYERLVTSEVPPDLGAEAECRQVVIDTLADLRRAFQLAGNVEESDIPRRNLLLAVRNYLRAEKQRSEAAQAFTDSKLELPVLERAIAIHRETADQIRMAALNSGAFL